MSEFEKFFNLKSYTLTHIYAYDMEVGTNNVFEVFHRNSSFCLEAAKNKALWEILVSD